MSPNGRINAIFPSLLFFFIVAGVLKFVKVLLNFLLDFIFLY